MIYFLLSIFRREWWTSKERLLCAYGGGGMVGLNSMKRLLRHEACWNGSGGLYRLGKAKLGIILYMAPFGSGPCRGLSSEPGQGSFLESELRV